MLELAPELRGLEHNAFFRAILWRRRRLEWLGENPLGAARAVAEWIGAGLYIHLTINRHSRWGNLFQTAFFLFLFARWIHPLALLRRGPANPNADALLGVSHRMIQDLRQCGYDVNEIIRAAWGSAVTRNEMRRRAAVRLLAIAGMAAATAIVRPAGLERGCYVSLILCLAMALPIPRLEPFYSLGLRSAQLRFLAPLGPRTWQFSGSARWGWGRGNSVGWFCALAIGALVLLFGIPYSPIQSWIGGDGLILWIEIAAAALLGYLAGRIIVARSPDGAAGRGDAWGRLMGEVSLVLHRVTKPATENPYPTAPKN